MTRPEPPTPARDDWRTALADWADPVTGETPPELPEPLPDDLVAALEDFLAVDDTTEPATEMEIASIVQAVRRAEAERRRREAASGRRLLAAVLALAVVGLVTWWVATSGDAGRGLAVTPDAPILELSTGTVRGAAEARSTLLPEASAVTLVLVSPSLDAEAGPFVVELHHDQEVERHPVRRDAYGAFSLLVDNLDALDSPLRVRLLAGPQARPVGEWTLVPGAEALRTESGARP